MNNGDFTLTSYPRNLDQGSRNSFRTTLKMIDYSQFHAIFPGQGPTPYSNKDVQEIETLRKSFNGVLFIDRVLKALSIGEGANLIVRNIIQRS